MYISTQVICVKDKHPWKSNFGASRTEGQLCQSLFCSLMYRQSLTGVQNLINKKLIKTLAISQKVTTNNTGTSNLISFTC